MSRFLFPKWTNKIKNLLLPLVVGGAVYMVVLVWLGASPKTLVAGYSPVQPVPFSHAMHAGELGLDCRYCHTTVETAAYAAIPPTATCMNCHEKGIKTTSPKLAKLREAFATEQPMRWEKIHDLPDYAYFNHASHVTRGVGCKSCHGRIDQMERVYQQEPLSMAWCLDCHRAPEKHLRPLDQITNMAWAPENQLELGLQLKNEYGIKTSTDCSTCHR
ncbi:MAG: cytochrome c3 family protein [Planctomycetes bacterium]|nr:cytochrome c3 family protein [Planctomycetota bacterium]